MVKLQSSYFIDIKKQKKEFGSITPFSHNHGYWSIEGEYMEALMERGRVSILLNNKSISRIASTEFKWESFWNLSCIY